MLLKVTGIGKYNDVTNAAATPYAVLPRPPLNSDRVLRIKPLQKSESKSTSSYWKYPPLQYIIGPRATAVAQWPLCLHYHVTVLKAAYHRQFSAVRDATCRTISALEAMDCRQPSTRMSTLDHLDLAKNRQEDFHRHQS